MKNTTTLNSWPSFSEAEISSVATVLRSGCVNYWTGPYVQDFEQKFSDWTGIAYSVGHANGTLALRMPTVFISSIRIRSTITPRTFIATSSALVNTSLIPVFADVDRTAVISLLPLLSH